MNFKLYPWQKKCLESWEQNEYRGIVNAVTGAGKTRLALAGIMRLNSVTDSKIRVKIVVPGKTLLMQWKHILKKTFASESEITVGVHGNGYHSSSERKYMVYIINSARYCLARQILKELKEGYTVLLIADECHNYTSNENRKIFEFLPYLAEVSGKYCALGLSATAEKAGYESILIPALGKEIYRHGLAEALRKGTVCDFAVWQIAVNFQPEEQLEYEELTENLRLTHQELLRIFPELKYYDGTSFFTYVRELAVKEKGKGARLARTWLQLSYKRKRTVHMAQARTSCAYQLIKELGIKRQVLIFGESISQIEHLYTKLNLIYPYKIGRYHSQMGNLANHNTLERFRNGELRILLTCRALDEGMDVPEAAIGIILSGTAMKRQRLQRLGRILRKHDGKRMACLFYLFVSDSLEEHAYFPEKTEYFQVHDLSYDDKNNNFSFPAYEKAANAILTDIISRKLPEQIYTETLSCLHRGYFREDWLLFPEECAHNMAKSTDTREQNYWICMQKMSEQYHSKRKAIAPKI